MPVPREKITGNRLTDRIPQVRQNEKPKLQGGALQRRRLMNDTVLS